MKKLIALCLALALFFAVRPVNTAHATGNAQLSSLSDEGILAFLDEYNIEIPEGFAESDAELARIVRAWITAVEDNPNVQFIYNFKASYQFSNAVKDAVNSYYDFTPTTGLISTFASSYQLQQSTLWSLPSNASAYNCYAYALGRTDDWYTPGDFSPEIDDLTSINVSVSTLADYVIADLKSDEYGYECFVKQTNRPDYDDLTNEQTAICIRKGQDNLGYKDFHLARLFYETEDEYGDAWRHKPGPSYILQYIDYPSSDVDWIAEGYLAEGAVLDPYGTTYTDTIYYIIFAENCDEPVLIHNYHQGASHYYQYREMCSICGKDETYTIVEACDGTGCSGHIVYPLNLEVTP